jgi:hypothetical protein
MQKERQKEVSSSWHANQMGGIPNEKDRCVSIGREWGRNADRSIRRLSVNHDSEIAEDKQLICVLLIDDPNSIAWDHQSRADFDRTVDADYRDIILGRSQRGGRGLGRTVRGDAGGPRVD